MSREATAYPLMYDTASLSLSQEYMSTAYDIEGWVADDDADDETKGDMPFTLPGVTYIKKLGEGGQGKVVLVETKHGQAALKWSGMASHLPDVEKNDVVIEANNLEALGEHPHLIKMLGRGDKVQGNTRYLYVILELHEGDLFDWQLEFRKPAKHAEWKRLGRDVLIHQELVLRHMAAHVGLALEHMQSKGYIHRDVKPENMGRKWTPNLVIVLADLGFARQIADEKGQLTNPKLRNFRPATTWSYAGPATLKGLPQYYVDDAHTLIFSLVRSFYIYGKHPMFDSHNKRQMAYLKEMFLAAPDRFLAEVEPPAYRIRPLFPQWLLSIIENINLALPTQKVDYSQLVVRPANAGSAQDNEEEEEETETNRRDKRALSKKSSSSEVLVNPSIDVGNFLKASSSAAAKSAPIKKAQVELF